MYSSASQYGAAPAPPGYRGSPVQVPTGRQYAATGQGYPVYAQHAQHAQHTQHQHPQQQGQVRYPVGYVQPGVPVAGVPVQVQGAPMMVSGQYQQQAAYYAQQQAQHQQHQHQQPPRRQPHKGTIPPGQMVRIGNNTVRVERYLSEGGYAHVYLTTSDKPIYPPKRGNGTSAAAAKGRWGEKGYTEHCLKRIAFEDENVWADVSKEIEVMKSLPPSPHLIQYLDSSHHRLPNGTHEVFILMEYCSGGGIIDLLNKRLRDRLKEIEILNIFTDVCEAVAAMHALPRPLLHRDLKIENVLSNPNGLAPTPGRPTPLIFKLCDFGSTTFPATSPPSTKAEADALAMDLNKHTTLQYRSPEMVEPMLGWPVGLPSDVWALGVLLYKLCYYTTPFEEHGTLAIVNAKYTFPQYPVYSPRLQHLIASMLVEHPTRRPSVFEVLKVAHDMSGTKPLVDYPSTNRPLPATIPTSPTRQQRPLPSNTNVLDFTDSSSPPEAAQEPSLASTVTPQRRGRPTKVQPPPPQLPATVATVTPTPVPIKPGQSEPFRQPYVPSSTLPTARPRLQVTGEGAAGPAPPPPTLPPKHQPSGSAAAKPAVARLPTAERKPVASRQDSVDAFGAPKTTGGTTATSSTGGGFGDSFSVPRPPSVTSPTGGFGDAFGVTLKSTKSPPTSASSGVSGFGDSFTGSRVTRPPPPSLPSGSSSAGFSDSFTAKFQSSPLASPAVMSPLVTSASSTKPARTGVQPPPPQLPGAQQPPSPKKAAKEVSPSASGHKSPSSEATSPAPGPEGELTFEQRFPSVEMLHGTEKESEEPKEQPPKSATVSAAAAAGRRRPSLVIANLTGGDLASTMRSPKISMQQPQLPPLPRSTQVTGTAFKSETRRAPEEPAASASATADYLSLMDEDDRPPQPIMDLMDDRESESMKVALAPLHPALSKTPSSGSRYGVSPSQTSTQQQQKPAPAPKPEPTTPGKQGAAERATLPPISAERPATNMNSESWSPLERMRTLSHSTQSPTSPTRHAPRNLMDDSSDDEGPADNANGSGHRPISPVRRGPPSPGIARRMSSFEPLGTRSSISATGVSPPLHSPASAIQTASARNKSTSPAPGAGSRPQSMFVTPSHSPLGGSVAGLPSTQDDVSGHTRRGSANINDIVSRYEAMNRRPPVAAKPAKLTGASTGSTTATAGSANAYGIKVPAVPPSVPTKPAMLRKPSGGRPMPGKATTAAAGPKPTTTTGSTSTTATTTTGLRRASTINVASKPPTAPKPAGLQVHSKSDGDKVAAAAPSAPSQVPTAAAAPTASDSKPTTTGYATTTHLPEPQLQRPQPVRSHSHSASASTSRSSSPEKQQPVNLLIARWNKGQV